MARALALTAGLLAVCLTGCFGGATAFTCERNEQCNAKGPGTCQPNGRCSYSDPNCPSGESYGDNSGPLSGVCVGQEPGGDGGIDMTTGACYGEGIVKPCFPSALTEERTLPATVDTTNSPLCSTTVTNVPASLCVIAGANITVAGGTVAVIGTRPLVLVAANTINVTGILDAASRRSTTNQDEHGQVGAGADPVGECASGTAPGISGGGAGGTFIALGGNGGNGNAGGVGGVAGGAQTLALRGGCRGQNATGTTTTALGGRGGGAVYLIARTIDIQGQINASGGGGNRGITGGNSPGGGGGSGGFIGLDAMTIDNTGLVFANGGGGGEGSGGGSSSGLPGLDPTGVAPAGGGAGGSSGGNGGNGGAGGTGGGGATGGTGQAAGSDGGGGGGGGTGVIKVYGGTLNGEYSPNPTP